MAGGSDRLSDALVRPAPLTTLERCLDAARWYRNRLASMSAVEIGHRAGQGLKRAASRHWMPVFGSRPACGLQPWPGLREGLRDLAREGTLLEDWRSTARRFAEGRIALLGVEWPDAPSGLRWHLDPVTRRGWPSAAYCFDIGYRRAHDMGDVKYVWELNRLQYLQPIAALAALDGDAELAKRCCREIESWVDSNPAYKGVNWACGIELALRVASIIIVASLLESAGLFAIDRKKLWATLEAHGYWIRRFPSQFSSANNHRVAEAGALYLLGTMAPDLPGAEEWAEYGRTTLTAEVCNQIHEDGVGAEQSPTYTAFTLEWLLLCGVVARNCGRPFPEAYWRRIASAGEFLRWITDEAGFQPRIGDDDEGRLFCSRIAAEPYVASVLGALAAAVHRPDLAPPDRVPHLREAFLGQTTTGARGASGVRQFPAGGYTVARALHAKGESLVVFDHGPVGFLSIAAHGHADALAFWLHVNGRPILVDAGTYLYHAGGAWRDYFRGTPAHNTLSIAGGNSSRIAGPFNWSNKARARVTSFGSGDRWHVEAEHDGFVRDHGVRHRRRLERTGIDDFAISDVLVGAESSFDVDVGFLLHPSLSVTVDGAGALIRGPEGAVLRIQGDGTLVPTVQVGATDPLRGWYSSRFGKIEPAMRIAFTGSLAAAQPCRFALHLWPDGRGSRS